MKSIQVVRRFTSRVWGETENVVLETGRRLNALGHEAKVVCPNVLDPVEHEAVDGVDVTRFPYFRTSFGLSAAARSRMDRKGANLFSPRLLAHLLREPRVDIFHVHTGECLGGTVRTAARLRGIPYVVSLHDDDLEVSVREPAFWPVQGALEWGRALGMLVGARRLLADAAAIICVGEDQRRLVEAEHPEARVIALPNGVDPERFREGDGAALRARLGVSPNDEFLLVPGPIEPDRNQALALEVLIALKASRPRLRLGLIGPVICPDYLADLLARARILNVEGRGSVFEANPGSRGLPHVFQAADLVIVPAARGASGVAVLEAWAATRPVLASAVGGLVDLIAPGEDALTFMPADVRGFAAAVSRLLDDRQAASALALAGHAKARASYTWDSITRRLANLYTEVLEESARTPRVVAGVTCDTPQDAAQEAQST